jgi:hypothetical protein
MQAWPPRARWVACATAALGGGAVSVLVALHQQPFFAIADADKYLRIAAGHSREVMQPFPSRQLSPLLAATLAKLFHTGVERGFLVETALALPAFLYCVVALAARTAAPRWLLAAVVLVPSYMTLVQDLAYPDLLYAALLAITLLFVDRGRFFAAALMLFPLMLTRESTSLTLLCFLAGCWGALRWRDRLTAVLSAAAGSVVVARLAAGSLPNADHLPPSLYLLAKLPWNFLRNVLGIVPWSDANTDNCRVPIWSFPFHFGPVHALGICGLSFQPQLVALQVTLTNFGLLPLLAALLCWRYRSSPARTEGRPDPLLRFCLLYGGISFLLSPLLGAGFVHLVGYAWPLFLVAVPRLFNKFAMPLPTRRRALAVMGFLAVHLALYPLGYVPWLVPGILADLALWTVAAVLLRVWLERPHPGPAAPPDSGLRKGPGSVPIHSSRVVKSA